MAKLQSAGVLLYRIDSGILKVLLVHPGGPYFARKDDGAWTIPKGLLDDGEDPLAAAKREFEEELGQKLQASDFKPLTPVKQKGGKTILAWAAEGEADVLNVKSNTFKMEYPYRSGKWIIVPEVDMAEWFTIQEAKQKINPGQAPLLDELQDLLKTNT